MKGIYDKILTLYVVRLLVACALISLGGCLITVTHYAGGSVTNDLGADCADGCVYQLIEGESLNRTFTAVAFAGNEFVRWRDSVGDGLSICSRPTELVCQIKIDNLHANFEGLTLDVEAQFRSITGNNVNNLQFIGDFNVRRVIRKLNDDIWLEIYAPANVFYYYRQIATTETSLGLYDKTRDFSLHFNLVSGNILEQQGLEARVLSSKIASLSAKLNGLLVSRVAYGNTKGNHLGDFVQVDASNWVERSAGKQKDVFTYTEMKRDDSTVYLYDESRDVEIQLDVLGGLVYSTASADPEEPVAIIQRLAQPVSGWNASEVSYTDNSGVVIGYFSEKGESTWVEAATDKDIPPVNYSLTQRNADVVTLLDSNNNIRVRLDLLKGVVTSQQLSSILTLDKYKIVEAK